MLTLDWRIVIMLLKTNRQTEKYEGDLQAALAAKSSSFVIVVVVAGGGMQLCKFN